MKIKLTVNSNVKLPEHLAHLDMKYGFSYYNRDKMTQENPTVEDSFSVKLLAKLDNYFGVSDDDKKFVNVIGGAIEYANNTLSPDSLENMSVQINNETQVNKNVKGVLRKILKPDNKIFEAFDSKAAYIRTHFKQIVLGSKHSENSSDTKLINKYGKEKVTEFIFFHELGHSLEFSNKKNYYPVELSSTNAKIGVLAYDPILYRLNKSIKELNNDNLSPIDSNLIKNLRTVKSEIYADVSGILYQRNLEIERKIYDKNKFEEFVSDHISFRQEEQSLDRQFLDMNNLKQVKKHTESFDHLTSPGIDGLNIKIEEFGDRALTQEEIHTISQKSVTQGMARYLHTIVRLDNNNIGQLNSLFSTTFNSKTGDLELDPEALPSTYKTIMDEMKQEAGGKWFNNFEESLTFLKGRNLDPAKKTIEILDLGMKSNKQIEESLEIDYLFSVNTPKPQFMQEKEKQEELIKSTPTLEQNTKPSVQVIDDNSFKVKENIPFSHNMVKKNILELRNKIWANEKSLTSSNKL